MILVQVLFAIALGYLIMASGLWIAEKWVSRRRADR